MMVAMDALKRAVLVTLIAIAVAVLFNGIFYFFFTYAK